MNLLHLTISLSFLAISGLSVYGIYADNKAFSLNKIFWLFCLFFMGITPWLQFGTGIVPFPWMKNQGNQFSFLQANLVILSGQILYWVIWKKKTGNPSGTPSVNEKQFHFDTVFMNRYRYRGTPIFYIAVLLQILIASSLWNRIGVQETIISNSSLQLLADKSLKGIVLYFCLLTMHLYRQKKIDKSHFFFVLALAILSNFPSAVPRYWLATLYLGCGLSYFTAYFMRNKQRFVIIFSSALIFLFPLLNLARGKYSSAEVLLSPNRVVTLFISAFCGQDFDAYASFRNTILYVGATGISWGKQLLTVFLFFVPRTVWPDKGIGSGAIVNKAKPGSDFTNYSSPLFAEGYINFGTAGSLLFIAIFAWISSRYDSRYWSSEKKGFAEIMYPASLGLSFFLLRGDLLSSFAYSIGIFTAAYAVHLVVAQK